MTTRLATIAGLLLALLLQLGGLVVVWRDQPLAAVSQVQQKGKGNEHPVPAPLPGGRMSLQPAASANLPDLNQGYLFNAERNLAGEGSRGPQTRNALNVSWDKVQYNGSIITGAETKALLSYPLSGQPAAGGPLGAAIGVPQPPTAQGFLRVVVGDLVNGYKVSEILPGKIVFTKGDQKITKSLYDKNKERRQPQVTTATPAGQPPAPGQPATAAPAPTPQETAAPVANPRKRLEVSPGSGEQKPPTPRRRPLTPQNPQMPDAKNLLQMLMERQRQINQSQPQNGKNITP